MVNSLPNYKILDYSKLKLFADDKMNMTEKNFFSRGVANTVGKVCFLPFLKQILNVQLCLSLSDALNFNQSVILPFSRVNPFLNDRIWTLPNSEFADNNFKFVENG